MSTFLEKWNLRHLDLYAKQHAAGEHDAQCEQRERSSLCHCSKRRRVAQGITEVPDEDLYFPPPACPRCSQDLEFDGDGFNCPPCHLWWSTSGAASSARFTDEYGADFGGEQFGRRLADIIEEPA